MKIGLLALVLAFAFVACGDPSTGSGSDDNAGDDADDDADDDDASDDDDTADDDVDPAAHVTLPDYPWWPNDAMAVDGALLDTHATAYCETAAEPNAPDFLLGELPLASFDALCAGEVAAPASMGSLYLSGYFGGLWLRDALDGLFTKDGTSEGFESLAPVFRAVAWMAGRSQAVLASGDDGAILAEARSGIAVLAMLFGYNRGYLDQILAHPPDGATPPDGVVECGDNVFDCVVPDSPYGFMTRFDAALASLADPPNDRWAELGALVDLAEAATAQGELVWNAIPLDALDQDGYDRLIDLSAGFLVAAKAAVLGDMTAWANETPGDAECSLLLDGGMWAWSMSYFMGLASPASPGTFPTLECPAP